MILLRNALPLKLAEYSALAMLARGCVRQIQVGSSAACNGGVGSSSTESFLPRKLA